MARGETEKCSFRSRFSPGAWITPAQYLAENMCDRQARYRGKKLSGRFWEEDGWAKEYRLQTVFASRLLKRFPMSAIVAALRTPHGGKAVSLGARWLAQLVEERLRLDEENSRMRAEAAAAPVGDAGPEPPRPPLPGRSLFTKLAEEDGKRQPPGGHRGVS
jgi:hypothetical protein